MKEVLKRTKTEIVLEMWFYVFIIGLYIKSIF